MTILDWLTSFYDTRPGLSSHHLPFFKVPDVWHVKHPEPVQNVETRLTWYSFNEIGAGQGPRERHHARCMCRVG
jgi:hypothetical protein